MGLFKKFANILIDDDIEQQVERIDKTVGSYGYDAWGYNSETAKIGLAITRFLYEDYFKVKAEGLEHIPNDGGVLIVANHSGQLPIDGMLIGYALATRQHHPRAARAMIERFLPSVPFIGNLFNSWGAVIGDPVNCSRMLDNGEAVIVFPEGARGAGKLYKNRYQLQSFGSGFMRLAMKHQVPVVPVGVVGCEETMPTAYHVKTLAKLLSVPYIPLTTPLPLPARVSLHIGEPKYFGNTDREQDINGHVESIQNEIRALMYRGLTKRERIF